MPCDRFHIRHALSGFAISVELDLNSFCRRALRSLDIPSKGDDRQIPMRLRPSIFAPTVTFCFPALPDYPSRHNLNHNPSKKNPPA
jgi:hypothetical protein